ncbi:MAG TPA: FecR family protein [Candidatus Sulfotelmatobacter sp.]
MSSLSGLASRNSLCKLTVLLAVFFTCALIALPAHAGSQARIVRLSDVQGSVQIDKNSGLGFENAFLNLPVTQGSQIQTRGNGRAEIEFEDGSTVRLAPNSRLEFNTLGLKESGQRLSEINLAQGTAYVNWAGKSGDAFTLNFSREKVDLDRAAHLRIDTAPDLVKLAVFKGEVQVSTPSGPVAVQKKKMVTFSGENDQALLAKNIEPEPLDSWDKESIAYHDQYARNNSSPYGYGASDMNYYGSYTSVPGYGMMWQPFFTGAGWDPFMDGAWSWYPGYGYMFVSAYPWGWMPYRYGNWAMIHGYGWMWQPGNWNSWSGVPRYSGVSASALHSLIVPTGTVKTVIVGRGGALSSAALPSQLIITRGSAGIGVPRGALGNLKSLNNQVAKSGLVQTAPSRQLGVTSRGTISESRGASSSRSASSASAAHASSVSSSHASVPSGHR